MRPVSPGGGEGGGGGDGAAEVTTGTRVTEASEEGIKGEYAK